MNRGIPKWVTVDLGRKSRVTERNNWYTATNKFIWNLLLTCKTAKKIQIWKENWQGTENIPVFCSSVSVYVFTQNTSPQSGVAAVPDLIYFFGNQSVGELRNMTHTQAENCVTHTYTHECKARKKDYKSVFKCASKITQMCFTCWRVHRVCLRTFIIIS